MKRMILSLMTSGLDPEKNAITRISVKINGKDKVFDKLIQPYDKIYDEDASRITELTGSYLFMNGVKLEESLFDLEKFVFYNCGEQDSNKPLMIGYNVRNFDIPFLKNAGFEVDRLFKFKILDLFNIVVGLDYIGFFKKRGIIFKDHKLPTVCNELGIPVSGGKNFDKIGAIENLNKWLEEELGSKSLD